MKLRTQTIIAISLFALLIFGVMSAVASFVIQPGFKNLENQESIESITQAKSTLNYQLNDLEGQVKDYSQWDDTYTFTQDRNEEYITNNFVDDTFENLNLNIVAIFDNSGTPLYLQSYNRSSSEKTETSPETKTTIASDKQLWNPPSQEDSFSGIMLIDNQPTFVATGPIMTSLGEGPVMGRVLFGRYIDDQEIQKLGGIMDLNFSLTTISESIAKQNSSQIVDKLLSNPQKIVVEDNDPNTVSGYILINDVNSNPLFILQVSHNRTAYQQGQLVSSVFMIAAIALSIFFGAGIMILLERSVVAPMTKLASYVKEIPLNPKDIGASPKTGTDETKILAQAVKDSLTQKLEAMNEVSRMVGHDLRNPLTGIKGAAYILKKKYSDQLDERGRDQLKTISDCVEYSDKIVKDLLEYSCDIQLEKSNTTLKELVNDSLSTISIPRNIQVLESVGEEVQLTVDNGRIERVFTNLIKNSFDAMPKGGILKIYSKKTNGFVITYFSDSGTGMTQETLKRLWTPFFTTKAKGMGVGLSICKRIINAHRGKIEVESTPGKGTTFKVSLPSEN